MFFLWVLAPRRKFRREAFLDIFCLRMTGLLWSKSTILRHDANFYVNGDSYNKGTTVTVLKLLELKRRPSTTFWFCWRGERPRRKRPARPQEKRKRAG